MCLNFGNILSRVLTDNNSAGLYAEYVDMFLKWKPESSGFPSWVQTEGDKDRYIEDYWLAEGIAEDQASISKNSVHRN